MLREFFWPIPFPSWKNYNNNVDPENTQNGIDQTKFTSTLCHKCDHFWSTLFHNVDLRCRSGQHYGNNVDRKWSRSCT